MTTAHGLQPAPLRIFRMQAEAAYHTNDATNALKWLNMVRQRAGLDPVSGLGGTALRGYSHDELKTMFKADGVTMFGDKDFQSASIFILFGRENPEVFSLCG